LERKTPQKPHTQARKKPHIKPSYLAKNVRGQSVRHTRQFAVTKTPQVPNFGSQIFEQ